MLRSFVDLLRGCTHSRMTFPFTPRRRNGAPNAARGATYVVCLDCGKEFDYDWKEMRIGLEKARPIVADPAAVHAAPFWRPTAHSNPHEGTHSL